MDDIEAVKKDVEENLLAAKQKKDIEDKRLLDQQSEKNRIEAEKLTRESRFVENIKNFLLNLADAHLCESEIVRWEVPEEKDTGENFFELRKTEKGEIFIRILSPETGLSNLPMICVGEISTMSLAMLVYNRLKWIQENKIEPVISG